MFQAPEIELIANIYSLLTLVPGTTTSTLCELTHLIVNLIRLIKEYSTNVGKLEYLSKIARIRINKTNTA